jgi:hypothetical protein
MLEGLVCVDLPDIHGDPYKWVFINTDNATLVDASNSVTVKYFLWDKDTHRIRYGSISACTDYRSIKGNKDVSLGMIWVMAHVAQALKHILENKTVIVLNMKFHNEEMG